MAKVKNINGTSDTTCKCGSWYAHWRKYSGYDKTYCSEDGCTNRDPIGAHVQKYNSTDEKWYIVPLCRSHNASTGTLDIGNTTLVPANKSETCDS